MLILTYAERDYSPPENGNDVDREAAVGWTLDGRAFIIRNKDDLVKGLLPMFFRQGKLASFTRKLYRWGFRQVSVSPDGLSSKKKMIFGHEWFQRDNKQLMASMRSITAAGTRRRALGSSKQKSKSASERTLFLSPRCSFQTLFIHSLCCCQQCHPRHPALAVRCRHHLFTKLPEGPHLTLVSK
jgi:hypothetical protein